MVYETYQYVAITVVYMCKGVRSHNVVDTIIMTNNENNYMSKTYPVHLTSSPVHRLYTPVEFAVFYLQTSLSHNNYVATLSLF